VRCARSLSGSSRCFATRSASRCRRTRHSGPSIQSD
jgi:hypothetical protein